MQILLVVGSVFVGLAALIHVYIFYLESITWSKPGTWKTFGLASQAQADTMKPMAYNQGFYNLFLAVGVIVGLVLVGTGVAAQAGYALTLAPLSISFQSGEDGLRCKSARNGVVCRRAGMAAQPSQPPERPWCYLWPSLELRSRR